MGEADRLEEDQRRESYPLDAIQATQGYGGLSAFLDKISCAVKQSGRDLTLRQVAVLLVCQSSVRPQTVTSLARHLQIGKPAVTRAVDRLEEEGLISRKEEVADRRSIILLVTARGNAYCGWFASGPTNLDEPR